MRGAPSSLILEAIRGGFPEAVEVELNLKGTGIEEVKCVGSVRGGGSMCKGPGV